MNSSADDNIKRAWDAIIQELVTKGEVPEDALSDSDSILHWWRGLDKVKQDEITRRVKEFSQSRSEIIREIDMAQDMAGATQSSLVLAPTVGAAYGNGWRQMWKHFLGLFLIGIIALIIGIPGGVSGWEGEATDVGIILGVMGFFYSILVINPTNYGVSYAYLKASRNDKLEIRDMFEAFHNYWSAVLANVLVGVIVVVGFFLLIIPGIIFACKLAFTPYLVVDRKMEVIEAVKESWRMTNGHAWTVFLIGLLAIPISIIGLICLVVGIIPATMWITTAFASLYHAVSVSGEI